MIAELEIHDIGAAVKLHRRSYLRPWRSWAPYRELGPWDFEALVGLTMPRGIRLVIAVTACWVESDGRLVPYEKKFPEAARVLRQLPVTIACHGLTHCVLGSHRATWWRSNRWAWREFYPWLPEGVERIHLERAKIILEQWCGRAVTRLVPPGDVYSPRTETLAAEYGYAPIVKAPRRIHDRDVVRLGADAALRLVA